ncbi:heparinase II/III domain-containing protein [Nonomuraea angiospora]|uniref:heparinase II/III domain-containing protein n=1 Tax=Nonomuraea angiospora TaxID=46172 RepID=UPI0029A074C4|nr:heparinase II/III family protein [Nonomuraea angiospora]MDX3103706.1 heparinase II/III family protein [Nonomuraea angiospora]
MRSIHAALTLALLTPAAAADPLPLVNGGFETWTAGLPASWSAWRPRGDGRISASADAAEGTSAAELSTDTADDRVAIIQKVTLPNTGGGLVRLRAKIRSAGLTGGRTSIRVQPLTASGVSTGLQYFAQTTGTTAWHEVDGYLEVPAGAATVSLEPMIDSGVGTFAVDALSLEWAGPLPSGDGWQFVPLSGTPASAEENGTLTVSGPAGSSGQYRRTFPVKERTVYASRLRVKLDEIACQSSRLEIAYTPMKAGRPIPGVRYAYTDVDQQRDFVPVVHNVTMPTGADAMRVEVTFTGPGTAWIETAEPAALPADVGGAYPSSRVSHPLKNPQNMMGGSDWDAVAAESDQVKRDKLGTLATIPESDYVAAAKTASASRTGLDVHPEFETHLRRFAELGERRKAVLGLIEFARGYDTVPYTHPSWSKNTIPFQAVRAYDLVYDAPDWTPETRALVESWLRRTVVAFVNLADKPTGMHNIEVYGYRYAFAVASVLGDPDLVRYVLPMTDRMFSGRQFFADGIWEEATTSYHDQVMLFARGAFTLLAENYADPAGYTGEIKLDHTGLVPTRYPIFAKASAMGESLRFPDGVPVTINDTHFPKADDMVATDPITDLKNIELYGYGHYALTAGDTQDALQAHLTLPPTSEGLPYKAGHGHGDHLGLILWGSGMEVLPDQGYPTQVPDNRYWHMDTPAHNTPWIWSKDNAGGYTCQDALATGAAVLAYDDGATSGKGVQLIEASEPGPAKDGAQVKRRLLAVIQSPQGRYVLDVSRLKGGDAHQWFLRASEDEDVTLDTTLPLQDKGGTVKSYYESIGKTDGLPEDRDLMRDPRVGSGTGDLSFTWTGARTGTAVRAFVNGSPGDEVIFSKVPTLRRTGNDPAKKNAYPNWHFQRRSLVTPADTTTYAAVYETMRTGQQGKLSSVTFEEAFGGDPMTTVARIETPKFRDIVYVSDSTQERVVDGITMAGRFVLARVDKATGAVLSGYVNGAGHLYGGAYRLTGQERTLTVTGASSAWTGAPATPLSTTPNALTLDGTLPGWAKGLWATTRLGDGRGWGMRVDRITPGGAVVHDWVPFEVGSGGAATSFYPRGEQVPGAVTATVRRPAWATLSPATLIAAVTDAADTGKIHGTGVQAGLLAQLRTLAKFWDKPQARRGLLTGVTAEVTALAGKKIDRTFATDLINALKSARDLP